MDSREEAMVEKAITLGPRVAPIAASLAILVMNAGTTEADKVVGSMEVATGEVSKEAERVAMV